MSIIRKLPNGRSQIIKDEAFVTLTNGTLPNKDTLITHVLDNMDTEIQKLDPKITREALSNAHGDWYEWLLAISAWNVFANNPQANLAIPLPNISRFDVAQLYETDLTLLIEDLREKVYETAEVKLISSNPDFVIISREVVDKFLGKPEMITSFNLERIATLNGLYEAFIKQCKFNQIIGYVSVKTSLRPDRRLQIAHEGSLMKAIYIHLQTRKWVIQPSGLKYFAIATKLSDADRNALRTVATHSITTVSSLPQAAVDGVFEVNSLRQADDAFLQILI